MIGIMYRTGFLGRIWQHLVDASEAAVSVHYHQPWLRSERSATASTSKQ